MTPITTIIFDLGGVFLHNIFRALFKYLIEQHGANLDTLRGAFGPLFHQWKLGKMNEKEFWTRFAKNAHLDLSAEKLMQMIRTKVGADEDMLNYAKVLKKKYSLIAASNNTKELGHDAIERFKLKEIFDEIYLSCDMQLSKPDRAFFDYILNDLKKKPEECLFIDDKAGIIAAAKSYGFQTVLFVDKKQLEKEIQNLINAH